MDVLPPELWGEICAHLVEDCLHLSGLTEPDIVPQIRPYKRSLMHYADKFSPKNRTEEEILAYLTRSSGLRARVYLTLSGCCPLRIPELSSRFAQIEVISLMNCGIADVSCIAHIPVVHLFYCRDLVDISPLGGQDFVDIMCCPVRDVSSLAAVRCVCLTECPAVTDVSSLAGVEHLTLARCDGIASISSLGGENSRLRSLQVEHCGGIADFSAFARTPGLRIAGSDMAELFDAENDVLALWDCAHLTDISRLRVAGTVDITRCPIRTGQHTLANVLKRVRLSAVPDIPGLPTMRARSVSILHGSLQSVACLKNVARVTLSNCPNVADVSPLSGATRIVLDDCAAVRDISALQHVKWLQVVDMDLDFTSLRSCYHLCLWRSDGQRVAHRINSAALGHCYDLRVCGPFDAPPTSKIRHLQLGAD